MDTYKSVFEQKGKLLEQLRLALSERDFDQEKVNKLNSEIDRKEAELQLIEKENVKIARGSGGPAHEIRSLETGRVIESAGYGDLEQYVSDIVRVSFGHTGIQNRDLLESSGSGQYIVPQILSGPLVSYIIEKSLLGRVGVKNVAVETDTTTYAQVSTLPTADIIAEGAELTEGTTAFTSRTLQTYSFRAGEIISQEWEEDSIANPQNVIEPLTQSIADHIDNMFINGTGSGEPYGLAAMPGVYMRLHMGPNGLAISGFEQLGHLWRKARESNFEVSAYLMSPRTLNEYRLLEDAEECPKQNPYAFIPMLETNQVLNTDTQGTSSNATKVIALDKKGVMAGWRYGGPNAIKFIVDRSTLAEFGKVRIYAYVRMGLAHPYGGACIGYVKGVIPPTGAIT